LIDVKARLWPCIRVRHFPHRDPQFEEADLTVELNVGHGHWVVVCDGAKALIFENVGNKFSPKLQTREVFEQDDPKTSELGTGAPGRSFSSSDMRRSAMEQTDLHDQAERAFLQQLASRLDVAVTSGATKGLTIVAPPRALGVLRQAYSPHVRDVLHGEIDKDYVKLPVHEIEKHLAA
jgi:protein required for attachment to host cells